MATSDEFPAVVDGSGLQISEYQPTSERMLPESFCATLDDDSEVQPSDHGLDTQTMVTETEFPAAEQQLDGDSDVQPSDHGLETQTMVTETEFPAAEQQLDVVSEIQPSDHGHSETMVPETEYPAVADESELQVDDDSEAMVPQSPLSDFDDEADVHLTYTHWKAKYLHLLLAGKC